MGFSEEVLYRAQPGCSLGYCTLLGDGKMLCMEISSSEGVRLVRDGKPGPWFDRFFSGVVSWDNRRAAYGLARGSEHFVVLDGVSGPAFKNVSEHVGMVFSPDGSRLLYGGCDIELSGGGFRVCLVLDGELVPDTFLVPLPPAFSRDGRHLAYAAQSDPQAATRAQWVVHDDVQGPQLAGLNSEFGVVMSPDGKHVAYAGTQNEQVGSGGSTVGAWSAYLDDEPGPMFDAVSFPAFSADGSTFAYVGRRADKMRVVRNGEEGPEFDVVGPPILSPNGERLAHLTMTRKKSLLRTRYSDVRYWVDAQLNPEFDEPQMDTPTATFSPDSQHFAYLESKDNNAHLVVDRQASTQQFDEAAALAYTGDGTRAVFVARQGKKWMVVEGDERGPACDGIRVFEGVRPEVVAGMFFLGPSGNSVAYGAVQQRKGQVVFNRNAGPLYDEVRFLVLSADGQHVAYAGRSESDWVPIVDGEAGPRCSHVAAPICTADGFSWAAARGEAAIRVDYSIG